MLDPILTALRGHEPIIQSLLDIDFYKFTMGQLVFHRRGDVRVTYGLTNRTKRVRLADHLDLGQLREELDHARTLRFSKTDLHYLRGTNEYGDRMFSEDYLEFLAGLQLPEYDLSADDGQLLVRFSGLWREAIYWETIALSIINELYSRSLLRGMSRFERDAVVAEGVQRLRAKIRTLREHPSIRFSDFGTRRRFSHRWQDYIVGVLAEELPAQFLGTSDTLLAMKHALLPMGTNAHELPMVYAALAEDDVQLRAAQRTVLDNWWDEYGWGLSVALTDTFGTDAFFSDFTPDLAKAWKGVRQDSGDPFIFGEKAIEFYRNIGVDPAEKLIVFSDGLELPTILQLENRFAGRVKTTYGWGTNLTNDLGFDNLSLVVKVVAANGRPTVKLSDNLAKAMGPAEEVERYKRVFGYKSDLSVECKR